MTKEELLERINGIEWEDFECKEALNELPKSVWETVSAFSNTAGGWIVLGVKEIKKKTGSLFTVMGVNNPEKMEQDFISTLRSKTKFNVVIFFKAQIFDIDGDKVLAFWIPSSAVKPVYFNGNILNTFIRCGSGDQRATDGEIAAIQRDQAFGSRSEIAIPGTSIADLNHGSLDTFRRRMRYFNESSPYNEYSDEAFCLKTGITSDGCLTFGGLLMFGKGDVVKKHVRNFWIDYIEIPGTSYADAAERYTYRMPELENIWESYQAIYQRLRLYVDNPFTAGPDGFAPDDNSQLYCLREGLVNFCAHADYFSPMHPTIRKFDDRIEFQNPGCFIVGIDAVKNKNASFPRNPTIINLFRYVKLFESAGYGIDKILKWEKLTKQAVDFSSGILYSTVTYYLPQSNHTTGNVDSKSGNATVNRDSKNVNATVNCDSKDSQNAENKSGKIKQSPREIIIRLINENKRITSSRMAEIMGVHRATVSRYLKKLQDERVIHRVGSDKKGYWEIVKK